MEHPRIDDTQFGFTYSRLVHLIFWIRGVKEEEVEEEDGENLFRFMTASIFDQVQTIDIDI